MITALVAAIAVVLGLLGTPGGAGAQESRLNTVLKRGEVIIGTTSAAPPFGFVDEKGELVGFDIDIGRLVAKALFDDPAKAKFVPQSFEARWASVQSGKVDFGIMSTTIYPDRLRKVAFTRAYIDSGIAVLVRKDVPINHLAELNSEKFTMAILNNPQSADRHKRFTPKAKALTFDSPAQMLLAVKTGQAQGMQFDVPVINWMVAQNANAVKRLPELMTPAQNNAIFLQQGDFTWWHFLDAIVGEMRDGSLYDDYKAIYKKWFGTDPPAQRWYLAK
jgi:polar amino acid transport system substrate-binding protein